jgi:antitoxin ParD1/3/4
MTISITLSDELSDLVEAKVAGGDYASSEDVVRAALKLLERRDSERSAKLADLRAAIQEGIDSGEPQPLDIEELLAELHDEFNASTS